SYESVKRFAARLAGLPRLDIMLENAGIATTKFRRAEEDESTITVNVVSTFLLALLVLPKLRETSTKFNTTPYLTIVTSEAHHFTSMPEKSSPNILEKLNDEATADMEGRCGLPPPPPPPRVLVPLPFRHLTTTCPFRYPVSKLLEVFYCRELASRMQQNPKKDNPTVVLNLVCPGLCHSELTREGNWGVYILKLLFARTTEVGSRNFLWATTQAGPESHGEFIAHCRLQE
ncbi:MAG: hypothetical protein Q9184_008023, partial [Pyrenodesmia sp. 2 TL-2023]